MIKCEKCGADMPWVYGLTTCLAGGVVATLCARCRTEWNEFASAHPTFQRLRELECVRNSIVFAQELVEFALDTPFKGVLEEIRECEAVLHKAGLKWIGRED